MATVRYRGAFWLDRALKTAHERGLEDRLSELAVHYMEGRRLMTYPDPTGQERVRVEKGDIAVVMTPENVVIGFVYGIGAIARGRPPKAAKGPTKGGRGPTSYRELLVMLQEAGYEVVHDGQGGHRKVIDAEGHHLYTMSSTPSDTRALANDVAGLRRTLKLKLRLRR